MFRDRDEELQRIQQQLLEVEEPETEEADQLLDEDTLDALLSDSQQAQDPRVYQNFSNDYGKNLRNYASGYKAYNSDRTDTELDSFSEEVREPKQPGKLLWLAFALLALAVAVVGVVLWLHFGRGGLI